MHTATAWIVLWRPPGMSVGPGCATSCRRATRKRSVCIWTTASQASRDIAPTAVADRAYRDDDAFSVDRGETQEATETGDAIRVG